MPAKKPVAKIVGARQPKKGRILERLRSWRSYRRESRPARKELAALKKRIKQLERRLAEANYEIHDARGKGLKPGESALLERWRKDAKELPAQIRSIRPRKNQLMEEINAIARKHGC